MCASNQGDAKDRTRIDDMHNDLRLAYRAKIQDHLVKAEKHQQQAAEHQAKAEDHRQQAKQKEEELNAVPETLERAATTLDLRTVALVTAPARPSDGAVTKPDGKNDPSVDPRLLSALTKMNEVFTTRDLRDQANEDGNGRPITKTVFYGGLSRLEQAGWIVKMRKVGVTEPTIYRKTK